MIRLERDGMIMEVATDVAASAFIRAGYKAVEEKAEEHEYSKTEINRMSKSDLLELAKTSGIEVDEYASGNALKDMLIEKLVK